MSLRVLLPPLLLAISVSANAAAVFDSIADFSSVQGSGGWQYGYYSTPAMPDSFTQMTFFQGGTRWAEADAQPPWTLLWAQGGHPNGSNHGFEHWAVRRWVSDVASNLSVSGSYAMADIGHTQVSIWVDGILKYQGLPGPAATSFTLPVSVHPGSTVDFAIAPLGNDFDATTTFSAVAAVPEPSSYALMLAGLIVVASTVSSRRRQRRSTVSAEGGTRG